MANEFREDKYFLSNMYPCPISYEGMNFLCAESAFQAQKSLDVKEKLKFTLINGYQAKRFGRQVKLREDWENIKLDIMKDIVRAKFTQNPELKSKLLNTGSEPLIEENSWGDTYWGIVRGRGENHLGLILEEIRDEIRSNQ